MTAPVAPKSNLSTAQSDPDSLKINGHEASNGHDALDLAGDVRTFVRYSLVRS